MKRTEIWELRDTTSSEMGTLINADRADKINNQRNASTLLSTSLR
jgi:hypothetical protein